MGDKGGADSPSLVHAAVRGVRRANRPRERAENLMIAYSGGAHNGERKTAMSETGRRQGAR